MELKTLIERAASVAGSYSALARELHVTQPEVSQWLHDRRPCPLQHQARMCELVGEDPKEHVWREVKRAMGKRMKRAAGVVAMLCWLTPVGAPPVANGPTSDNV